MTTYYVTRWFEGMQREIVPATTLEAAVSLLGSAGDDIMAVDNGTPRPLTAFERGRADQILVGRDGPQLAENHPSMFPI
jgi:hypothetical protein